MKFLRERLNLAQCRDVSQQVHRVESGFNDVFHLVRPHLHHELRKYMILRTLKKDLKDIIFGFGPLQDLLRAPTVTEIMVVSSSQIYVERDGIIERSGRRFISDKVTEAIIERIVAQVGRRIDKSQPLVDARLPDGSRVNAIIPPLAIKGPCLTVRKFPAQRLTMDDLLEMGSISRSAATFLRACVVARRNILVSGGTGTRQDDDAQRARAASFPSRSGSSRSKTRPNCGCTRSTSSRWRRSRPTSKGPASTRSATW